MDPSIAAASCSDIIYTDPSISQDDSDSKSPRFAVNDRVYAPDTRGHFYLAIIRSLAPYMDAQHHQQHSYSWKYLVHYCNWPKRHDSWIPETRIVVESEKMRMVAEQGRQAPIMISKRKLVSKRLREECASNNNDLNFYEGEFQYKTLVACIPDAKHEICVRVVLQSSNDNKAPSPNMIIDGEDTQHLCARWIPWDPDKIKPCSNILEKGSSFRFFRLSYHREEGNSRINTTQENVEDSFERAARARKRRLQTLGISRNSLELSDDPTILVGQEEHLRFAKSRVHGWGIYTDSFIKAGDLVVEYRGILIGNAVANKREKMYEEACIGSDYMFRLDATTVIDATKRGNIARFINASCNPNCFTKVVTNYGIKKIGIFALRDILPGEELNYDYKFQPEFDESKRIPCNCTSLNCRGFMNWDKRW